MRGQDTGNGGRPADRRDEILARRESRRRQLRRRRILAAGALLSAFALAAALVGLQGSSGGTTPARASKTAGAPGAPAVRSDWRRHLGPVPILEYHGLGSPPANAPYPELYVSRPDFHRQMDWLERHGYEGVTLDEVEDAWYGDGRLPPKPVVISFDDGYRPQFTFALPELRRHGWPGVLNLKAEGSDLYGSNVEAMLDAGWELAAHTIHHLDLTELDGAQLKEEVAGSRQILRREYGVPVDNFCYPAGRFDERVIDAVREAGYRGATTEIPGYATRDRPYELNRFEVLGSSGVAGVAADLGS